jgi:hypothetical protein
MEANSTYPSPSVRNPCLIIDPPYLPYLVGVVMLLSGLRGQTARKQKIQANKELI